MCEKCLIYILTKNKKIIYFDSFKISALTFKVQSMSNLNLNQANLYTYLPHQLEKCELNEFQGQTGRFRQLWHIVQSSRHSLYTMPPEKLKQLARQVLKVHSKQTGCFGKDFTNKKQKTSSRLKD
jgi:hypothetical protein